MEYITDMDGKKITIKQDLRFIDSYEFMPSTLDALLKTLKSYPNLSRFCSSHWGESGGEQLQLMKKGVYPTEYVNPAERFKETQLPPEWRRYI